MSAAALPAGLPLCCEGWGRSTGQTHKGGGGWQSLPKIVHIGGAATPRVSPCILLSGSIQSARAYSTTKEGSSCCLLGICSSAAVRGPIAEEWCSSVCHKPQCGTGVAMSFAIILIAVLLCNLRVELSQTPQGREMANNQGCTAGNEHRMGSACREATQSVPRTKTSKCGICVRRRLCRPWRGGADYQLESAAAITPAAAAAAGHAPATWQQCSCTPIGLAQRPVARARLE